MARLIDPLILRGIELRNRIVFAPVVTNFGLRKEQALKYFAERARGGAGLIIVHAIPVDLFLDADWARRLGSLVKAVQGEGGKIAIQLWHGNDLNGQPVAPSARGACRLITRKEILRVVDKFATAAGRCREVGFDGAEIHGAHGYFVQQFFSPLTNQRDDDYGGSMEKRMRFSLELIGAMRKAAGKKFLLLFRHSAVEGEPGGATLEESARLARALETQGLDVMDISAGGGTGDNLSIPEASAPEARTPSSREESKPRFPSP